MIRIGKNYKVSELSEWLTAIGTLATAIVAILVSFFPSIRRWYNRPRFAIEFRNEEPFCRIATVPETKYVDQKGAKVPKEVKTPFYWMRIKVLNVGKAVAKNCEGKLVRIVDAKTKEERKDFDPVVLGWVGATHYPIDINKTEYEYLNVLATKIDDAEHFFITSVDKEPRGINLAPERKDYIFHIVLYGENVEPFPKSFYLKNHKEFDKIELLPIEETEVKTVEHRQNGWLFLLGIILGVISNAWINSIFATVEARIANNLELDLMYSQFSIMFNVFLIIYVTMALAIYFHVPKWQLILWDIGLFVPILFVLMGLPLNLLLS